MHRAANVACKVVWRPEHARALLSMQEWDVAFWAPASKAVLGRRQKRLGSLLLSEEPIKLTDDVALPVLIKVSQLLCQSQVPPALCCR